MNKNLGIATLSAMLIASPLSAEIYKWVDENGRTYYSEVPPGAAAKNVEKIGTSPKSNSATPQPEREGVSKYSEYLESERLDREEKRQQEQQQLAKQRERCDHLRKTLADYENGGVIYYDLNAEGEREFWSEQRLEKERQLLARTVKKDCSGV